MKPYNITDAAAFLEISRQTLYRLSEKTLPPDELSATGKKLWHHQTLVKFRYAGVKRGLAVQFTADSFGGISCSADGSAALQGIQIQNYFIESSTFVGALSEVMAALTELKPSCVVLPQLSLKQDIGMSVVNACLASGIGIYIEPGQ